MKISKYLHSCLVVEDQGKTILVDPGNYSVEDGALTIEQFSTLDAICLTHEHQDHMYLPFVKQLVARFPNVQIFGTTSIKKRLEQEGITASAEGNEFVTLTPVPHEKIFIVAAPENVMITLFERFATPGDSLSFKHAPEILALPIQAPWGHATWAADIALKVKPKTIIPIHDWHWKDEVRKSMYERLENFFEPHGIRFLKPDTDQVFEL